ncbi:MAG: hypothetical protein JW959_07525 [Pirellulales bacterium]|nr:hypothetical protein [Pirellulales bacterium]
MTATSQYHDGATAPVILPLRADEARAEGIPRFLIPELPSPSVEPAIGAPTAIWPAADSPAIVRASAAAAETIYRRLQPNANSILALTSPGDGDGKTCLTISLAPELAKRVGAMLVVDADHRKADLSKRLVLTTRAAGSEDAALIYPTNHPGLNVLPYWGGGDDARHGPTTVDRRVFWDRDWFDDLRQRWPLVLLDGPSLEHAEPAPIMRNCSGVYLVVRTGHTARRAVAQAARAISARGGRLLGSLVIE